MNSSEFEQYLSHAIRGYADEHVKAGNWNEQEALSKATKEYERLLPDGEKTANNTLFTIRDEDKEVGMIWLAQRANDKGFIYDINIREENQGRGYGKQAMIEIEKVARKLGLKSIKLHVFGHNRVARGLYEKLGYLETDIVMEKKI
ncbi:GNAT family N-acetyltransferase [Mesobacillus maritimus]|nr:GNAT family N-acetyltransferase [Mesobacillus maritimus]MCM3587286.1 GNAT family N-acetyltransferase [Mesobacillus maritimus]